MHAGEEAAVVVHGVVHRSEEIHGVHVPVVDDHGRKPSSMHCQTDQIGPEHQCVEQYDWWAEEGEDILEQENFQLEGQFGTVERIEEDGLLPAVALLDEVCEVEGRLLLDNRTLPLDRLALVVLGQAHRPVLAYRALQPHVEPNVAFDGRVYDPVRTLDAHLAPVEETERPFHLQWILSHSDTVAQCNHVVKELAVFELRDVAIRERRFLAFVAYFLVFTVAKLKDLDAVRDVKVRLLVHV